MRKDYTAIALIVDRSGSMSSVVDDTIGGVNSFVNKQREVEGDCSVTLVQFDDRIETIHDFVDIKQVPELTSEVYFARGWTALYDAIGMTSKTLGERLASMPEEERPAKVIVAVITDGQENHSTEYTKETIKAMITEQETKYNWDFNFISADLESYNDASNLGFSTGKTAFYSTASTSNTFDAMASKYTRVRNLVAEDANDYDLLLGSNFSDDELCAMTQN
jgi:uncharacterized protein YegL